MRKIAALIIAGALGASTAAAAARDINVGTECTYPPFNYRDASGTLQGFDVDIAREVGKRIGAKITFVCQAWDGMIPGLLAGKFDMIAASMSITENRLKSISFSIPYRSSTGRFVGPKDSKLQPFTADGKPDPQALKGKIVGIERATTYERYLTDRFPGVQLARYDTADNLLLDLKTGRVDLAMAGPIKISSDFLDKPDGKGFAYIGPEVEDVSYFGPGIGLGLRKNDAALLKDVDAALKGMFADGTFKKINLKYWSFTVLPSAWK